MRIASSLLVSLVLSLSTLTFGCATTGGGDEYGEDDAEAVGIGKLAFFQSADGQWRFNVKSANGAILLASEAYTSRTGAINGALSVLDNGVDPAQYRIAPAQTGYVVRLVATNNEVISVSEVYATKSSATRAVTSCVRAVTSYLDNREALSTGARVEIAQGDSGQFHFNFFARNGQIVLSSEAYTTEAAAYNGAMAVQTEGQNAAAYTLKQNTAGGFFFVITAQNGQVIGTSQQYTTKQSAEDAALAVRSLLPSITVL